MRPEATAQYSNVFINFNNNSININGKEKFNEAEISANFYPNEPVKKNFDTFNHINFKKQRQRTPFDDEDSEFGSGPTNQVQNIFGDMHGKKKNRRQQKKIKSDEMNPFEDDEEEVRAKDMISSKKGIWDGFNQPRTKGNQLGRGAFGPQNQKNVEAQFDKELEESKKKRYVESPFEIRVEDKVESAYEYLGKKIKESGRALKKLDKKLLKWIRPPKQEKKIPVNANLIAEVQSNSINTLVGGQSMPQIRLDPTKKLSLDVHQLAKNIQNDRPLVKRIKTKQDLLRQKQLEKARNPFEEDYDLPILPPKPFQSESTEQKIQKYFSDQPRNAHSNARMAPQPIKTPFIDDFTKDDFDFNDDDTFSSKNNIFSKPSQPIRSQRKTPQIFDDFESPQLSQSGSFSGNRPNQANQTIQKVMASDFLNFEGMNDAHNAKKDFPTDDFF